jgi:hypothetical protein
MVQICCFALCWIDQGAIRQPWQTALHNHHRLPGSYVSFLLMKLNQLMQGGMEKTMPILIQVFGDEQGKLDFDTFSGWSALLMCPPI